MRPKANPNWRLTKAIVAHGRSARPRARLLCATWPMHRPLNCLGAAEEEDRLGTPGNPVVKQRGNEVDASRADFQESPNW